MLTSIQLSFKEFLRDGFDDKGTAIYEHRCFKKIVITGFNTDIERDGVVYHVQTEDKGLDSPLILSLVYSGGEILAAKRTPYEDLIAEGFTDQALAERLKRQHRLICAAIKAGRIEELKQMGSRREEATSTKGLSTETTEAAVEPSPVAPQVEEEFVIETASARPTTEWKPPVVPEPESESAGASPPVPPVLDPPPLPKPARSSKDSAYTVYDSRRPSRPKKRDTAKPHEELALSILDDDEFVAGQSANLRVLLQRRVGEAEKPLGGVALSIKVLGSTFRPQIYSVKTQRDGVALISIVMPTFSSGRAAVVIHAEAHGEKAELRRVIHPAD